MPNLARPLFRRRHVQTWGWFPYKTFLCRGLSHVRLVWVYGSSRLKRTRHASGSPLDLRSPSHRFITQFYSLCSVMSFLPPCPFIAPFYSGLLPPSAILMVSTLTSYKHAVSSCTGFVFTRDWCIEMNYVLLVCTINSLGREGKWTRGLLGKTVYVSRSVIFVCACVVAMNWILSYCWSSFPSC